MVWIVYDASMKNRKLLFSVTKKDFKIDYFSGTGAGGQHRNKHQNCVRIYHKDSGARSTGQSNRERKANINEAFQGLVKSKEFKLWMNRKAHEVMEGKKIEDKVKEMLESDNLRIETKDEDGKWVEVEFGTIKQ
jgi:peptide chain release factor 1